MTPETESVAYAAYIGVDWADGSEALLRPEVGFSPNWFHRRCGIDFSRRWHEDPAWRRETIRLMAEELRRSFPGHAIGGVTETEDPRYLITGVHGAAIMGGIFGMSIRYFSNNWFSAHGPTLRDDEADRLFDVVATTMIEAADCFYERQRRHGFDVQWISTANCMLNMISPRHYKTILLPHDLRLREAFKDFGVHNCAWTVNPHMDAYATIPGLGYIDMGLSSNLSRARQLFPRACRNSRKKCVSTV